MAELRGMTILQTEIEKAKDKLKDVNENIKKLTGRDPVDIRAGGRGRGQDVRGRGRLFNLARRGIMLEESGGPPPPAKRRPGGGAFARLGPMPARRREREDSPDEDEPPAKLSVQSSVIATSRDARSRQDTLAQQSKDREGMQRNRRMFGLLMGTLQKFKTEAMAQDQKAEQRKQIEKKLEDEAERDKKRYHQETQQLIEESQLEQAKITRLQQKMELVNEHASVTDEMKKLHNFICTRTKPRIFWKPKAMNSATDAKLKESKKTVEKMIQEKDQALDREISEVMEREHQREERVRSRLRLDKENSGNAPPSAGKDPPRASSGEGRRKSQDKKEGHRHSHPRKEAKKKQHEMQYDDGEEEMEVEREEAGDETAGSRSGKGGEVDEGEARDIKQEKVSPTKVDKIQESLDDGNNTDVDYEDDQPSEEGEEDASVVSRDILSAIPMPPEPHGEGSQSEEGPTDTAQSEKRQGDGETVTVRLLRLAQVGESEGVDEEEMARMEERRRRATRSEDAEDMEDEQADE